MTNNARNNYNSISEIFFHHTFEGFEVQLLVYDHIRK